jgi:hypothetical protein
MKTTYSLWLKLKLKWTGNENYLPSLTQTKVKMEGKWKLPTHFDSDYNIMDRKWKLLTHFDSDYNIMDRKWKLLTLFDSDYNIMDRKWKLLTLFDSD